MQGYNVIMVYNADMDKLLMCKRVKEPFKGLSNFVGGKIEDGETGADAAYRELREETGITREQISLFHLMDFRYYVHQCYVEVYVGKLSCDVPVSGDEKYLYWCDANSDFFDASAFAGYGNIGHMVEQVNASRDKVLGG